MSADRRFSKPLPLPTGGSQPPRTRVDRPASLTPPAVSPDDGGRLWITSPRPPLALVRLVQGKKAHDGQAHDVLQPPTQPTKRPSTQPTASQRLDPPDAQRLSSPDAQRLSPPEAPRLSPPDATSWGRHRIQPSDPDHRIRPNAVVGPCRFSP